MKRIQKYQIAVDDATKKRIYKVPYSYHLPDKLRAALIILLDEFENENTKN